MKTVIVEYAYDPPITDAGLAERSKKIGGCLENYRIRHIESFVSKDRRSAFCVLEATDTESVQEGWRSAGVAFERVWTADRFAS